ncbi:MAG: trans-sulfuration enzyme family protein [Candidatus Bipolaricaulia bacterium]
MTDSKDQAIISAAERAEADTDSTTDRRKRRHSTVAVHGGEQRIKSENSLPVPVFQTATYAFQNTEELQRYMDGEIDREKYGRYGNPTQKAVERKVAALEGGEAALLLPTGMAAVTTTLIALLSAGDHAIFTDECYKQTREFAMNLLPRFGVEVSTVAMADYQAIETTVTENTRVIFSESPTNPFLNLLDFERLVAIGRRYGIWTVVDSTFATPYNQRPLDFGVDLVVHSATKYLGGHNDLMAGLVVGSNELIDQIRGTQAILGGAPDPHGAYLLIRGLKTLALRMERHNENTLRIARFLEGHPKVKRVYYPGLESHPHHRVARRQMRGFGGVVSFELADTGRDVDRFVDALQIPYIASSFGGVESLVEQTALMSYHRYTPEQRARMGISDALIRFSVGIEDPEDLIDDLCHALEEI